MASEREVLRVALIRRASWDLMSHQLTAKQLLNYNIITLLLTISTPWLGRQTKKDTGTLPGVDGGRRLVTKVLSFFYAEHQRSVANGLAFWG